MAQQKMRELKIVEPIKIAKQAKNALKERKLIEAEKLVDTLIAKGYKKLLEPQMLYTLYFRLAGSYEDDLLEIRKPLSHEAQEEIIKEYRNIISYYEKAKEYADQLLDKERDAVNAKLIKTNGNLAISLHREKRYLEARKYYKEAIGLGDFQHCQSLVDCCFLAALPYFSESAYEQAIELCEEGSLYTDDAITQAKKHLDLFIRSVQEENTKLKIIEWCCEQSEKAFKIENYDISIQWCLKVITYISYCTSDPIRHSLRVHECLYTCYKQLYFSGYSIETYIIMAKQCVFLGMLYLDAREYDKAKQCYSSAWEFTGYLDGNQIGFDKLREKFELEFPEPKPSSSSKEADSIDPAPLESDQEEFSDYIEEPPEPDEDKGKSPLAGQDSGFDDQPAQPEFLSYENIPFEPDEDKDQSILSAQDSKADFQPTSQLEPPLEQPSPPVLLSGGIRKIKRVNVDFEEIISPKRLKYQADVSFFKFRPAEDKSVVKNTKRKLSESSSDEDETTEPSHSDSKEEKNANFQKQERFTQLAKDKIGRWGEYCVYEKLKQHYQKKYKETKMTTNESGFVLTGKYGEDNSKVKFEVIWHNKGVNIGEDRPGPDFTIKKRKFRKSGMLADIKVRYIEVKTTISNTPHKAEFTKEQLKDMMKYKEKYSIYRVFNAGQPKVKIVKIKNPAKKILKKELNVKSIKFKM